MIYLLDTDSFIFMVRGAKTNCRVPAIRQAALAVVSRCRQTQADGRVIGLSAISDTELDYGARNSHAIEK